MANALADSAIDPSEIDLINAHGTSTPVGDSTECMAIHYAFKDYATKVPVHSTKSMTGHLVGAAGGIEAIACLLAFEKGVIHPSINLFNQDPAIDLNVVTKPMEKKVNAVLSNSFGFGGQNSSIILTRFK
jgi:3-oxoacyl-[acyl-carrier-protein] synthase II